MIVDRLYMRWLWWKHTWAFQAAHKPLCSRFHRDVIRLGPLRLCRSCAALHGGFMVAALFSPLYVALPGNPAGALSGVLLLLIVLASRPASYHRMPRAMRDVLRAGLGLLGAFAVALLFGPAWPWGLAQVAGLLLLWPLYRQQRDARARAHDLCAGCAECGQPGICSGFTEQAAHLRNYEEAATRWLERRFAGSGGASIHLD